MLCCDLRKVIWYRWKKCFKFYRRSLITSTTVVREIKIPIDFYFTLNFISLVRFFFDKIQFDVVN